MNSLGIEWGDNLTGVDMLQPSSCTYYVQLSVCQKRNSKKGEDTVSEGCRMLERVGPETLFLP